MQQAAREHLRWMRLNYHIQICLGDNSLKFLPLFAINNTIHNHGNRAVNIFLKQSVKHFLFLWGGRKSERVMSVRYLKSKKSKNFKQIFSQTLSDLLFTHLCQYGVYRMFLGSTNTIPQRETVAGEACCRSPTCECKIFLHSA